MPCVMDSRGLFVRHIQQAVGAYEGGVERGVSNSWNATVYVPPLLLLSVYFPSSHHVIFPVGLFSLKWISEVSEEPGSRLSELHEAYK